MKCIYLSPHFDDAVLSCGGLIWEQTQKGEHVEIWTIYSADPSMDKLSTYAAELHVRWGLDRNPDHSRKDEDQAACKILNCDYRHLNFLDVIYRRNPESNVPIINSDQELFKPIKLEESYLLISLAKRIENILPNHCSLVCPLGVGGHIDHRLTRCAAETLGVPLKYYVEYPYCREDGFDVKHWIMIDWQKECLKIGDAGLLAWQTAISAYTSQINTFWENEERMYSEVESLWIMNSKNGCLWYSKPHL